MTSHNIDKQAIIQAADECVLCGLCLPHCPTYNIAQIEPESPRGRIALVRALCEEKMAPDKVLHEHLDRCLNCMQCRDVCPAKVDYEKIIDAGRAMTQAQSGWKQKIQQAFILLALGNHVARKLLKPLIPVLSRIGLSRILAKRSVDPAPLGHAVFDATDCAGARVAVVQSCAQDLIGDPTLAVATTLLRKLGCETVQYDGVQCCGALYQHSGKPEAAEKLKNAFIKKHLDNNINYIATIATGCGAQIKQYECDLNAKVIDINELLLALLQKNHISFKPLAEKVFVHRPCTQGRMTEKSQLIESLLGYIPEIELEQFADQDACCGAGGMNSMTHPKLANRLIDNKVRELKATPALTLVSSNIGCAIHLQARFQQENIPVQVCHPVTLLGQQMI